MRIGLEAIDSQIAYAMADRLCAPPKEFLRENIYWGGLIPMSFNWQFHTGGFKMRRKREPSAEERKAYEIRKRREEQLGQRILGTIVLPVAAGGMMGALSAPEFLLQAPIGVATWIAVTAPCLWWTLRARPKERLRYSVELEEMQAVFPLLTLSRAERIYCDTLLLLARMEPDAENEQILRGTLEQLNRLVESARQLAKRRLSLVPVLGTNSIAELQEEYGALGRQLDHTTDTIARQAIQQSLQMCATRMENTRMFEQGLERLKAQEEAIVHTLSSAQSALARMQIMPEPYSDRAAEEIAETVAQMNQQTYAVEQAVQEVLNLHAQ